VQIADRWFEVRRIDDAVTLLWEPHLHPVWQSNIWHIRGSERDLLVDAGMGIGDLAAALTEVVQKPLIALATHRHADHVGGLHQFDTRYGHPSDAAEISNPTSFASLITADYPPEFVRYMQDSGTPVGDVMIDAHPHEGYDPHAYRVKSAPLTQLVEDGDTIDLGDRVFTVVHLPGHTPGSIGILDETSGLLFSGDAIYDGPLYDFLPESSITDYVATMQRLIELPIDTVHGGHDGSFGRERLEEIAHEYLRTRAHKAGTAEAQRA
jgi:glyoxylase-like metal-dependent hydrolase (beta-lactamase superfamily II)